MHLLSFLPFLKSNPFSSSMNSVMSLNCRYTEANLTYATSSSFFSSSMTIWPISVLVISFSLLSVMAYSIRETTFSRSVTPMGRFSHAFFSPLRIFPLSKTSLRPSFLITSGRPSSSTSAVENLLAHLRHSRRLRMASISLLILESITLLSTNPQ